MLSRKVKISFSIILVLVVGGFGLALWLSNRAREIDVSAFIPPGASSMKRVEEPNFAFQLFQTTNDYATLEKALAQVFEVPFTVPTLITSSDPPGPLRIFLPAHTTCVLSIPVGGTARSKLFVRTTPTEVVWAHISAPNTNHQARLLVGGQLLAKPRGTTTRARDGTVIRTEAPSLKNIFFEGAIHRSSASAQALDSRAYDATNSVIEVMQFYKEKTPFAKEKAIVTWDGEGFQENFTIWSTPSAVYLSVVNRALGEQKTYINSAVAEAHR